MSESVDPRSRAERIGDPKYSENLETLDLDVLRLRRKEAEKEEQELSYVRRLLQGRLDIVRAEMRRRAGEGGELLGALPTILANAHNPAQTRSSQGRFHSGDDRGDTQSAGGTDQAFSQSSAANIATLEDGELQETLDGLLTQERAVSQGRSQVHRVIDRLSAELTHRYREGTAKVDDVLAAARRPESEM